MKEFLGRQNFNFQPSAMILFQNLNVYCFHPRIIDNIQRLQSARWENSISDYFYYISCFTSTASSPSIFQIVLLPAKAGLKVLRVLLLLLVLVLVVGNKFKYLDLETRQRFDIEVKSCRAWSNQGDQVNSRNRNTNRNRKPGNSLSKSQKIKLFSITASF